MSVAFLYFKFTYCILLRFLNDEELKIEGNEDNFFNQSFIKFVTKNTKSNQDQYIDVLKLNFNEFTLDNKFHCDETNMQLNLNNFEIIFHMKKSLFESLMNDQFNYSIINNLHEKLMFMIYSRVFYCAKNPNIIMEKILNCFLEKSVPSESILLEFYKISIDYIDTSEYAKKIFLHLQKNEIDEFLITRNELLKEIKTYKKQTNASEDLFLCHSNSFEKSYSLFYDFLRKNFILCLKKKHKCNILIGEKITQKRDNIISLNAGQVCNGNLLTIFDQPVIYIKSVNHETIYNTKKIIIYMNSQNFILDIEDFFVKLANSSLETLHYNIKLFNSLIYSILKICSKIHARINKFEFTLEYEYKLITKTLIMSVGRQSEYHLDDNIIQTCMFLREETNILNNKSILRLISIIYIENYCKNKKNKSQIIYFKLFNAENKYELQCFTVNNKNLQLKYLNNDENTTIENLFASSENNQQTLENSMHFEFRKAYNLRIYKRFIFFEVEIERFSIKSQDKNEIEELSCFYLNIYEQKSTEFNICLGKSLQFISNDRNSNFTFNAYNQDQMSIICSNSTIYFFSSLSSKIKQLLLINCNLISFFNTEKRIKKKIENQCNLNLIRCHFNQNFVLNGIFEEIYVHTCESNLLISAKFNFFITKESTGEYEIEGDINIKFRIIENIGCFEYDFANKIIKYQSVEFLTNDINEKLTLIDLCSCKPIINKNIIVNNHENY